MKIFKTHKKGAMVGLALTVALLTGGAAFAFFSSTGTGTGSASVGTTSAMVITQVGPGYDSLIPGDHYIQDQCFSCIDGSSTTTQFGNAINLSSLGRLYNVVVAMRNWNGPITNEPLTLSLFSYNAGTPGTVGSPIASVTQNFSFAGVLITGRPSVTNITFDFSAHPPLITGPIVYAISYGDEQGTESGLNVALSSSATNLVVGTDAMAGFVFWNLSTLAGLPSDFGAACTSPYTGTSYPTTGTLNAMYTWCNDTPVGNIGAYGSTNGADIPAIEFNVKGGGTAPLYPGQTQTIGYVVTNPGSSPAYVAQVTPAITAVTNPGGCDIGWFSAAPGAALNQSIPSNGSVFGTASVSMTETGTNQDGCKNQTVSLGFTSN